MVQKEEMKRPLRSKPRFDSCINGVTKRHGMQDKCHGILHGGVVKDFSKLMSETGKQLRYAKRLQGLILIQMDRPELVYCYFLSMIWLEKFELVLVREQRWWICYSFFFNTLNLPLTLNNKGLWSKSSLSSLPVDSHCLAVHQGLGSAPAKSNKLRVTEHWVQVLQHPCFSLWVWKHRTIGLYQYSYTS